VPDQSPGKITERLHDLARKLREAPPLGREAQRALAELIDELGNAAGGVELPPTEVTHLAESTAHLVDALNRPHEPGGLTAARARLEKAILGTEARAPVVAGVARRVLDALANLGI
jgi:hypothetical protein